jgi:hypothetical protein
MQTFLPYPDAVRSAAVLDRARLGKQRVETLQIMRVLTGESKGWATHPAVKMWAGYQLALLAYQRAVCREWRSRGYADTCLRKTLDAYLEAYDVPAGGVPLPTWYGDEAFHRAHRSNLLRKAPDHYRAYWPTERDDLPYVWPVS